MTEVLIYWRVILEEIPWYRRRSHCPRSIFRICHSVPIMHDSWLLFRPTNDRSCECTAAFQISCIRCDWSTSFNILQSLNGQQYPYVLKPLFKWIKRRSYTLHCSKLGPTKMVNLKQQRETDTSKSSAIFTYEASHSSWYLKIIFTHFVRSKISQNQSDSFNRLKSSAPGRPHLLITCGRVVFGFDLIQPNWTGTFRSSHPCGDSWLCSIGLY